MQNSSSNKRIAKNTIFLSVRMIIVLAISLYTTRVILQVLGIIDYGVYNVVCGFVAMFSFVNISMSNGIQRFYNYEYGKNGEHGANRVYCTALSIQALLAIGILVIVEVFGIWYIQNKMVIPLERMTAALWIFQFSILAFIVGIMQAPYMAAVIAHERLDFYSIVSILDVILKLGIVFYLKSVSYDRLIIYGILSTLVVIVDFLLYFIYCKQRFKEIIFHCVLDKDLFKKMIGFSGWNLLGSFSLIMESQGINLVINYFYGPIVNAARGVANQINGGVQSFVQNITMPVRPQVTQSYAKGEINRTMSLTYGVSKISSAILIMLALPASVEIKYLLHLWLGDNVPNHTSTFTILILLTSLVNNLNAAISGVVHATGVMKEYQLWGSVVRICSVPIAFLLISIYDVPEIGLLAVLFTAAASHSVCLMIAKKITGLSLREYTMQVALPIIKVFFICLLCVCPIYFFMPEGFLRLLVVCVMSVISVVFSFYFVAFNDSERQLTKQMLKPILSFMSFNSK